jgi:hypothetical protein
MNQEDLKERTTKFSLMINKLVEELPNIQAGRTIGFRSFVQRHHGQQIIEQPAGQEVMPISYPKLKLSRKSLTKHYSGLSLFRKPNFSKRRNWNS